MIELLNHSIRAIRYIHTNGATLFKKSNTYLAKLSKTYDTYREQSLINSLIVPS